MLGWEGMVAYALPMTSTTETALLNQQQIADLAGVKRPVVTMWRTRFASGRGAFPDVRAREGNTLYFDAGEVLTWLEDSRGIDPDALRDAAAVLRRPPILTPACFDLAHHLLGAFALADPGRVEALDVDDPDEIGDLVWDTDPDNHVFSGEVADASDAEILATATWVQGIRRGSLGPADAWAQIEDAAGQFDSDPLLTRITADVRRLVEAIASVIAHELAPERPTVLVRHGGSDLVAPLDEDEPLAWAVAADPRDDDMDDAGDLRGALRLARLRQAISRTETRDGADVEPTLAVGVDAVLPRSADQPVSDLLDALAGLVDDPAGPHFAVILGPAAALTDHLPAGNPESDARLHLVRQGFLRATVRLGRGGLIDTPTQHLALWVVGPKRDMASKETARVRVATADVSGRDLGAVSADLVSDILAALRDRPAVVDEVSDDRTRSHLMQVARHELLTDLLAEGRTEIVRRGAQPDVPVADTSAALDEALDAVAMPLPGVPDPRVPHAVGSTGAIRQTVQELLEAKRLALVQGSRLPEGLDTAPRPGTIPVLGAPELADQGSLGSRRVTLFDLTAHAVRVHRTEPGDVVFGGTPARAWVDADGGSVLQAPARALRVVPDDAEAPRPQAIVPAVLAADVAGTTGNIRGIRVRLLPTEQAARLDTYLVATDRARRDALARAEALARLPDLLADGLVAGTFDLTDTTQQGD